MARRRRRWSLVESFPSRGSSTSRWADAPALRLQTVCGPATAPVRRRSLGIPVGRRHSEVSSAPTAAGIAVRSPEWDDAAVVGSGWLEPYRENWRVLGLPEADGF